MQSTNQSLRRLEVRGRDTAQANRMRDRNRWRTGSIWNPATMPEKNYCNFLRSIWFLDGQRDFVAIPAPARFLLM